MTSAARSVTVDVLVLVFAVVVLRRSSSYMLVEARKRHC